MNVTVETVARSIGDIVQESGMFVTAVISNPEGDMVSFEVGQAGHGQSLGHVAKQGEQTSRIINTIMKETQDEAN